MSRPADRYPTSSGVCTACGKQTYRSRKAARAAAKSIHPGDRMHAYECGSGWHFGHSPQRPWYAPTPQTEPHEDLPVTAVQQIHALAHLARRESPGG